MIRKIFCLALSFIILSVFIRAETFGLGNDFFLDGFKTIRRVIFISYEDILLAIGLASLAIFLILLFKAKPQIQKIIYRTFLGLFLLCLVWAVLNVYAVQILNTPVNYQLLYYSDLMDSKYLLTSVGEDVSWGLLVKVLFLVVLLPVLARLFDFTFSQFRLHRKISSAVIGVIVLSSVYYFVAANQYIQHIKNEQYDDYGKVANPVLAFAKSMAPYFDNEPNLFQDLPPNSISAIRPFKKYPRQHTTSAAPRNANVKNVIFFVMESVPAEYVAGYDSKYDVTPELKKHLPEAMLFEDVYAHSPNSTNSLFSLLGSIYPELSFKNVVNEHPQINWPTLSSELKKRSYKTAFLGFSDNSYMKVGEYLASHAFDKITDHKHMPCTYGSFTSDAEGAEVGKDEACMIDAFSDWVSEGKQQQPFFAMLWTMQTHWPYFVSGPEKDYGVQDPEFNRYLNALHYSDKMLGKLLDDLKSRGLAESTLVVVLGDHGEAFGSHGQYGHGSNVYEENVRIPLIFINPLLFSGQKKSVIAGLVDIPVTIFDILGYNTPEKWVGSSLFDATRENIAYFFSTWSDCLYGCRTADHKIIYNVYNNRTMIFDLQKDPEETNNLAAQMPALVKNSQIQLGQWVQYNRILMNEIFAKSANSAGLPTK